MKNQIKHIALAAIIAVSTSQAFAGLDWTNGALSNPDNLYRSSKAVAYSTSGNVFVTGVEENVTGNKLIVTKKYSSTGSLLNSVTNSYAILPGTVVSDHPVSITLDGAGNVYVLGSQYATSSRANDIVVIKYNSQLVQQWKKLIYNTNQSNNFNDKPCKILLDASNNVYVTGTWSNVTITGFLEETFVQKYSSTGTLLYSTPISQALGKTIYDVNDMCIDNSLNVTVCARAKDGSNVYSIMYARIANTGGLSWKKFYSPNSVYNILFNPEIECTTAGTLYLVTVVWRRPNNYDSYVKLATVKLNSSGTMQWENLTSELNEYADAVRLRLDASNNIYIGSDYLGSPTPTYKNHRIYKINSSGTTLWVYTSAETSRYFSFETFSSTAVFVIFDYTMGVNPVLRKLDASNGNIIWSETISYSPPSGYHHSQINLKAIAVNATTSEVAFCGDILADVTTPSYAEENRWIIKKYGATSPRMAFEETTIENNISEFTVSVFPNPTNNELTVSSEQLVARDKIKIMDVNGKIVKQILIENISIEQKISVSDVPNGIYFVHILSNEKTAMQKIVIQH
jgi:Secretion system C-terminal sorting domain